MMPVIFIPIRSDGQPLIKLPPGCVFFLPALTILVGLGDIALGVRNGRSIFMIGTGVWFILIGIGVTINYLRKR